MVVQIDTDTIRRGAAELDAATETVQGLIDQFKSSVEGLADSFGSDMIGSLLDLAHQAVMEAISECFSTNIEDLQDYADTLREMAENHDNNDSELAEIFRRFLTELGV
ncbi:type VII secretion target [Glycomyces harbinensis]|uniref:Excreted virulence factor EspC, type VII ESX diderm n=1 Tax=Glycomyces harbinensis TaxID=58114 RepID=A0A1G6Y7I9_9ACTN|nr:type VII secretion target [Glycomyces harbinensis]SDD85923.1 Excreted virulence factor EspC, type VII ESX diderm [Glycomyces harbinensis]